MCFALALKVAIWMVVKSMLQAHQRHHLRMAYTCASVVNCPYTLSPELAVGKLSSQTSGSFVEPNMVLANQALNNQSNAVSLALGRLSAYRSPSDKCGHCNFETKSALGRDKDCSI